MTTLQIIIIIALCWLSISAVCYEYVVKDWNNPKWEKVIFSLAWPCMFLLWPIYRLHTGHW